MLPATSADDGRSCIHEARQGISCESTEYYSALSVRICQVSYLFQGQETEDMWLTVRCDSSLVMGLLQHWCCSILIDVLACLRL